MGTVSTRRNAFVLLSLLVCVSCKKQPEQLVQSESAQSSVGSSNSIDIPEDSRLLTSIAKGKISPEYAQDPEKIYQYLQDAFRKKFEEKEKDSYGHKNNSFILVGKISALLGYSSPEKLAAEFQDGKFKAIGLYTNENVDPLSNKGDKVPNYQIMNRALRTYSNIEEIKQKDPKAGKLIEDFDATFSLLPAVRGLVYRGTGLSPELLDSIRKSGMLTDPAYTSTSVDVVDAYGFLAKQTSSDRRQRVFMVMYGESGRFIPFGEFSREEEVLFPHGTKFKVNFYFQHKDTEIPENDAHYLFLEEAR